MLTALNPTQVTNLEFHCSQPVAEHTLGDLQPLVLYREVLIIRGWLFNFDSRIVALEISVPKLEPVDAVLGARRDDVFAVFPAEPDLLSSGFTATVTAKGYQPEKELKIRFVAKLKGGSELAGIFRPVACLSESEHPISDWSIGI